jgi:spoIIIJ-associated protein
MLNIANNEVFTFEAKTLEEVYEKASESLKCSITNLEIEIHQAPSKGLFGFFSKNAIISAKLKYTQTEINKYQNKKVQKSNTHVETIASRLNALNNSEEKHKDDTITEMVNQIQQEDLFNDFYSSDDEELHQAPVIKSTNNELINKITEEVNNLFSKLCYEIDEIKVDIIDDEQTVYIEFSGADSALLIGKEGYRYKALSYILFNWINEKYGMMLRLEVAQFLANQEAAIFAYLGPVIETIKKEGFFKTKILDGILVHIALTKLRNEFPDKYVAVKTTQKGEKYILVNEYRSN